MSDESKPMNLVQKLASIRTEIDHIEKKGTNPHFGYKYMKAEDVAGDIGDKLAEMNIVLGIEDGKCEVHESGKGWFVVTQSTYVFKDGDTGETHRVWSCGAGSDSSDKGLYKALTGALKYALTQALCMRVGDDAEADTDTDRKTPQNGSNARETASTGGQGAERVRQSELKALVLEARGRCGSKELGDQWLKTVTKEMGVTAETITVNQIRSLFERALTLSNPASADVAEEDSDIPW